MILFEFIKVAIYYIKYSIDRNVTKNRNKNRNQKVNSKSNQSPKILNFQMMNPATINLNKEQKLSSKFITFDCPLCQGKLQLRNEIEINPKAIKCKCNPCSFKISKK